MFAVVGLLSVFALIGLRIQVTKYNPKKILLYLSTVKYGSSVILFEIETNFLYISNHFMLIQIAKQNDLSSSNGGR